MLKEQRKKFEESKWRRIMSEEKVKQNQKWIWEEEILVKIEMQKLLDLDNKKKLERLKRIDQHMKEERFEQNQQRL